MTNNKLVALVAGAALVGGSVIAVAAAPNLSASAAPSPTTPTADASAGSGYNITDATAFISINRSGAVQLTAQNGEEYAMYGCTAHLTGSGARFSGCTGSGSAEFFGGKTPTSAALTGVAQDGQPHAGELTLSTADGSTFQVAIDTVNFPAQGAGSGCVFHPDSTTAAFSCSGGQEARS